MSQHENLRSYYTFNLPLLYLMFLLAMLGIAGEIFVRLFF